MTRRRPPGGAAEIWEEAIAQPALQAAATPAASSCDAAVQSRVCCLEHLQLAAPGRRRPRQQRHCHGEQQQGARGAHVGGWRCSKVGNVGVGVERGASPAAAASCVARRARTAAAAADHPRRLQVGRSCCLLCSPDTLNQPACLQLERS